MIKKIAILSITLLTAVAAWGQTYRFEVGPAVGITGYLGDLNTSNM